MAATARRPASLPDSSVTELPRRAAWYLTGAAVLMLVLVLWQSASISRGAALAELQQKGEHALALYRSSLLAELATYRVMPRLLSEQKLLSILLQRADDAELVAAANRALSRFNGIVGASDSYLMDTKGLTIAASNWRTDTSFVGHNFGFRPYFRSAMEGGDGLYVALGTASNRRGFYFSHPLRSQGRTLGVAVVKVPLSRLEESWSYSATPVLVTDDAGVAFLSNRPDWRFRTLRPLDDALRQRLLSDRKYGDRKLDPMGIDRLESLEEGASLVSIGFGGSTGERFLMLSRPLRETPWTLHVLETTDSVGARVATTVAVAASSSALLLMAALVLWLRTRYQRQVRNTLQKGHHLLEQRVTERTADLTATNQRLRHEIKERERAEGVARQTRNDLVQAAKLAVLGQVATGITHELNQPLSAIRSYSENSRIMLARNDFSGVDENLSVVAELTEHASSIVGQLKVFARRTDGETGPVTVRESIEHALALLAPRFRKERVALDCSPPSAAVLVHANATRLEQVLVNLLTNACDALMQTGKPQITVTVGAVGANVIILIADNGSGIQPEALDHIFDPFFTTKEVGSGLGLGLSISYEIVQSFGGHISAENLPGGGARFRLELQAMADTGAAGGDAG